MAKNDTMAINFMRGSFINFSQATVNISNFMSFLSYPVSPAKSSNSKCKSAALQSSKTHFTRKSETTEPSTPK